MSNPNPMTPAEAKAKADAAMDRAIERGRHAPGRLDTLRSMHRGSYAIQHTPDGRVKVSLILEDGTTIGGLGSDAADAIDEIERKLAILYPGQS